MKGDSGSAVIIIIVIVVAIAVFLIYFGGGGFNVGINPGVTYSNNVITVTNKLVSDYSPYSGKKTTIEFTVENRGKGTVDGVEVELEPPTGFTSTVDCDGSCKFDLEEGETRDVLITLTAEEVTQVIPSNVKYSINYHYSGEREAHVPIVPDRNSLPKGQGFFTSSSSFGPIQVSMSSPPARQTGDGSSAVFAIDGIPFKMNFGVSDVGSGFFGASEKVTMRGSEFKLDLTNLQIVSCDKLDDSGVLKDDDDSSIPDSGETVPFDFECTFEPQSSGDFGSGVVKAVFEYDYKLSFIEQFSIVPIEVPDIESTGTPSTGGSPTGTGSGGSTDTGTGSGGSTPSTGSGTSGGTGSTGGTDTGSGGTSTGSTPTSFSVTTDKSSYSVGDRVTISGQSSQAGATVSGTVRDSSGNVVHLMQTTTDSSGSFSEQMVLSGVAGTPGTYTVSLNSGGLSATSTFTVS